MSWYVEHLHRDGSVLARVPVQGARLRIGRALDNDLVLDDPHVAAHHAELHLDDDGARAALVDLGSLNGIARQRGRRQARIEVADDQALLLGQALIRVRHVLWPVPAERPLHTRMVWPWALLALAATLGYTAWTVWLGDLTDKSPPYLVLLSASAAILAAWSGAYAVLGRLISGNERFFSHLLIACCGCLVGVVADTALEVLAFASGWVWPMQVSRYVLILVVALTVRTHLRLADPGHWPALRWAVGVVALGVAVVPAAQLWISEGRLTRVHTLGHVEFPALRLAPAVSVERFTAEAASLKARADASRRRDSSGDTGADAIDEDRTQLRRP